MSKTKSKTAAKKKPATKPRAAKAGAKKATAKKATKKPAAKPAKAEASANASSATKKATDVVARVAEGAATKPAAAPRPSSRRDAASEWIAAAQRAKDAEPVVVAEAQKRVAPPVPIAAPVVPVAPPTSADSAEVDAFLRDCDHPRVAEFEQVRKLILDASPSIAEGIKWNAPSFRTEEWFATLHVRDPQKVQVVFHLGAKKRDSSQRLPVGAPEGMVEWLAPDRCMVTIEDVKRRGKALQAFVRSWILHV
jgi:hypothetical protein